MRFYNMDKRTDGMRCRRLLGAKLLGGGSGAGGKEDRIRFLLQAAEAARRHPSPPPPRPMFGGMLPPGLNQYMNVLSCLPNGMRPMLWPSLSLSAAPGGLLGCSGFQSNPLQNGMPSHAALLSSLAAPLSLTGGNKLGPQTNDIGPKATSASILSSMLALPSSTMSFQAIKTEDFSDDQVLRAVASSPERSNGTQKSFCAPAASLDFSAMPEDLTTTRRASTNKESSSKSPEKDRIIQGQSLDYGQYSLSHATSSLSLSLGENISATDLSSRDGANAKDTVACRSGGDSKVIFPSSSSTRCLVDKSDSSGLRGVNPSQVASLSADDQQLLLSWNNTRLASFLARSELFPSSSQFSSLSFVKPSLFPSQADSVVHGQKMHLNTKSPSSTDAEKAIIQELSSQDDHDKAAGEVDRSKPDDGKPLSQCHSTCAESGNQCKESSCPYLKKLKDLRRNVYRMLCVFTPYLGVADINDYEADSIDEFLHEVIYSKLDDTD